MTTTTSTSNTCRDPLTIGLSFRIRCDLHPSHSGRHTSSTTEVKTGRGIRVTWNDGGRAPASTSTPTTRGRRP